MEFALQYEIQRSRPHYPGFMYDIYHQATEQVKLADRLGYHSVWTVEHHFLNEWSYSSAPEVWYGALSQVTNRIRLGHASARWASAYLRQQASLSGSHLRSPPHL